MILVDIYVPVLDRVYDFYLDAHKPVAQLIAEISKLIAEKEDTGLVGDERAFLLCEMSSGTILNAEYSLAQQGIGEGAGLLLA